jgi:DNA topoisomerase-2
MSTGIKLKLKPKPKGDTIDEQSLVLPTDTDTNYSYLGDIIEDTYQDKDLREHIYTDPDTYAGSIAPTEEEMWYFDDHTGRMIKEKVTFIECFYKLFDETLVNALDQKERISQKNNSSLKQVKNVYIYTDLVTGEISVKNDGEGIDVVKHQKFQKYVPEMIFGHLLTSVNYDKTKDGSKKKDRTVGGKNGYGSKITNIFSKRYDLETVDSTRKLLYTQTWRDNMTICEDPVITPYTKAPYTKITYLPDYERFKIQNPAVIGDWKLIHKRAYDASACLGTGVSVFLNDKKIAVKNFEEYINLYIGKKSETKRAYIDLNDRWQLGVCLSPNGEFEQVSFVNGICTDRGGRHVKNVIENLAKKLISGTSEAQKKKGVQLKSEFIKKNLFLFLKSTIAGPNFDTQTKRMLTTLVADFGSKCIIPDEFVTHVVKLGILDRAKKLAEFKEREKLGKAISGKPRAKRIVHEKLTDAREAGGKLSHKCTIVFTEGDSAATFMATGISGIPESDRCFWGWFPLRGKILNTRTATLKQLSQNEEIKMINQIVGLENGKNYEQGDIKLRYGKVMFLTDADKDGYHIKGLGFNYFQQNFPSLLKRKGFICDFATPINKAYKVNSAGDASTTVAPIEFFSEDEYHNWYKTTNDGKGWKINYYKGLGTYEDPEARELCQNMRITNYIWNDEQIEVKRGKEMRIADSSTHTFDLAFDKKLSDERKIWVSNKTERSCIAPLKNQINEITYDHFINNYLVQFAIADNIRSIPHLCDGLKPSQRKVLFSAFKRKLTDKLKVAQFAGYVSEHSGYHHGEASLHGAIIHMAQDYVGSNNVNLLFPSGGFGTRIGGNAPKYKKGDDHASPRYICTYLNPITNVLFNKDDLSLMEYQVEEGLSIEPTFYVPILPLLLINGADGIGTGYSTTIPSYNPIDIEANIKAHLNGEDMAEMTPWYRGYNGKIVRIGLNKFITVGEYQRLDKNTIRILELPVGHKNCKSFTGYQEFLNGLLDDDVAREHGLQRKKKSKKNTTDGDDNDNDNDNDKDEENSTKSTSFESVIMDYQVISNTATDFVIDITFKDGILDIELANNVDYKFEKKMNIAHSFTISNMHMFIDDGSIKKFDDPRDIIVEFCRVRRSLYVKRKEHLLKSHQHDINKAEAKYRFVLDTIEEKIDIRRKKRDVVDKMLESCDPPYPKYTIKVDDNEEKAGYNYLLNMHMGSVTIEMLEKLKNAIEKANQQMADLQSKSDVDMWVEDLSDFKTSYETTTKAWYKYHNITQRAPKTKITLNRVPKTKITATTKITISTSNSTSTST